jgi:hypothetical protein
MSRAIDLTGQRFGKLSVLKRAENDSRGKARWSVLCDCGTTKIVLAKSLQSGNSKSCGLGQCRGERRVTHGHTRHRKPSPIYNSWMSMRQRVLDPNAERYPQYGASGVTICDRWLSEHGFENFLEDMGPRLPGTTLGRKGDIGNYDKSNCAWQNSAEQVANRRPDRRHGGGWNKKTVEQTAEQIAA